jgi:hypothetical protein
MKHRSVLVILTLCFPLGCSGRLPVGSGNLPAGPALAYADDGSVSFWWLQTLDSADLNSKDGLHSWIIYAGTTVMVLADPAPEAGLAKFRNAKVEHDQNNLPSLQNDHWVYVRVESRDVSEFIRTEKGGFIRTDPYLALMRYSNLKSLR